MPKQASCKWCCLETVLCPSLEHWSWEGTLGRKYFLLRDRKGLITAPMAIIAYYVMLNLFALDPVFSLIPATERPPSLLLNTDGYTLLLVANLILLGNRLLQRSIFNACL